MTTCGKVRFTKGAAENALLEAKIAHDLHGKQRRRERRTYECDLCSAPSSWHLTSSEARV